MKGNLPRLIPAIETEYLERLAKNGSKWVLNVDKLMPPKADYKELTTYFVESGVKAVQLILESSQLDTLSDMRSSYPDLTIIGGGGIRSIDSALSYIQKGVDYVVIGRYLSQNPNELQKFIDALGTRLIVSIDDNDGVIATNHKIKTLDYCQHISKHSISTIIYVNDSHKLQNQGINTANFKKIKEIMPTVNIIYSGGVSSKKDINELIKFGADSIILGTYAYNHVEIFMEQI